MAPVATQINLAITSIQTIFNRLAKMEKIGQDYTYQYHEDGEFGWNDSIGRGEVLMTVSYEELNTIYNIFKSIEDTIENGFGGFKGKVLISKITVKHIIALRDALYNINIDNNSKYTVNEGILCFNNTNGQNINKNEVNALKNFLNYLEF
jgi:hypothetical protein